MTVFGMRLSGRIKKRRLTVCQVPHSRTAENGGFTLLETLLTVAILVILLGLSIVGVARYKDHLKITELDNAARDIYMAAENRAVLLQSSGAASSLISLSASPTADELTPVDAPVKLSDGTESTVACLMLSEKTKVEILNDLLPVGVIDPTLRDGNFYILYDRGTYHVYEVFYAEGEIDKSKLDNFRKTRGERVSEYRKKDTDRLVGHYAGGLADNIGTKYLPQPGVEVIITNSEELTLTVKFTIPDNLPVGVAVDRTPYVRLEYGGRNFVLMGTKGADEYDAADEYRIKNTSDIDDAEAGKTVAYTCVLDSLEKSGDNFTKQFKNLFGSSTPKLGDDFKVAASLKLSAEGYLEHEAWADDTNNSLFAEGSTYGSDGTALIANLRHLQNLCAAHSNVGDGTVNAEQLRDIDCEKAKNNDGDYLTPDGEHYEFIPIVNDNLTSYKGQDRYIHNLSTEVVSNVGLFGEVSKPLNIENTRVCWDDPKKLVTPETNPTDYVYAVSGINAGGLIGSVSSGGDVTIKNSFAATTVKGETNVGGLIGIVENGGTVTIENSYADCYLSATVDSPNTKVGGLIGSNSGNVTLKNCYAAGFIVDPPDKANTAGLVNGNVTANNTYSVVRLLKTKDNTLAKPGTPLYGNDVGDKVEDKKVFYLSAVVSVTDEIKDVLGDEFEYGDNKPGTHAYNLRYEMDNTIENLAGKIYPFPGLTYTVTKADGTTETKHLPHYNDWADLDVAGLVYYEKYTQVYNSNMYGAVGKYESTVIDTNLPDDKTIFSHMEEVEHPDGTKTEELKRSDYCILKDGYALVFKEGIKLDLKNGYTVKYGQHTWTLRYPNAPDSYTAVAVEQFVSSPLLLTWTKKNAGGNVVAKQENVESFKIVDSDTDTKDTYILIPLPDEVVTGELADSDSFYQKLVCGKCEDTYFFNPHFAKTVNLPMEKDKNGNPIPFAQRPKAPNEPGNDAESAISVRTPRQLYDLSCFQGGVKSLVYSGKEYRFLQELDVDYSTYTEGYNDNKFPGSIQYIESETDPYEQNPIGLSNKSSFEGTYDGGEHTIRNVLYNADVTKYSYFGLFGHSSGTLQNIVYEANGQIAEKDGSIYMGSLTGYGATIKNCTVTVTGNLSINGSTAYGGGMAGQAGAMEKCTVTVNGNLYIAGITNTYGGGLAAYSESTTSCTSTVNGDVTVEGTVDGYITYGGGLLGFINDNGEKTTDCHAETTGTLTVTASGTRANAYGGGLAGLAVRWGGTTKGCDAKVGKLVVSVQATEDGTGLREAYAGGLVGRADVGSFDDCRAEAGEITVTGNGTLVYAGGLVGLAVDLKNCNATVTESLTIKGENSFTTTHGGGLIGSGNQNGTADGCHVKIKSLTVEGKGTTYGGGLAGDTGSLTGCASDITVGSVTVKGTGDNEAYGGGLVGKATYNVEKCSDIKVESVTVEGTGDGAIYGGGLVGHANKLENCSGFKATSVTVKGTGNGDAYGGGLVGFTKANVEYNCSATVETLSVTGAKGKVYGGGVAGYSNYLGQSTGKVTNMTVGKPKTEPGTEPNPDIYVETYAGGLAGWAEFGAGNCRADVTSLTVNGAGGKTYAGGLVGIHQQKGGSATVNNSTVKAGTITVNGGGSETYAGGVVGRGIYHVENCNAEITGSLIVTGAKEKTYAGGVAGFVHKDDKGKGDVLDCSVTAETIDVTGTGETYAGGVVGWANDVNDCSAGIASMSINGAGNTYGGGVAGVAGNYMERCGAAAAITVGGSGKSYIGGLVGETQWGACDCYAVGKISSSNSNATIAGLIGKTVTANYQTSCPNSYAAVAILGSAQTRDDFGGELYWDTPFKNCYYLTGSWTYDGENCSALETNNYSIITGKSYTELADLTNTLNAGADPANWGKLAGDNVYPFPVSTKKDGQWYYPAGDKWRIKAPDVSEAAFIDLLSVDPKLRPEDENS